ncbi:hypothetical protein EYR41_011222 [Orbilia oligospora]|uniref:PARP-type domain-containing protein n=1 Tax=Orbilia oligospora TaxID=2813651 RepID=A0A8H2DPK2_ORBOL|nr:hypothetical protein EYR41_011222 [Orbilia oligospora]
MPYRVEIASTGRAGCKGGVCAKAGDKILKGELRLGTWLEAGPFKSYQYRHWGCVTPTIIANVWKDISEDITSLDGYEELPESDQQLVLKSLQDGHVPDDIWKGDKEMNVPGARGMTKRASKKKAVKSEDEEEAEEEKEAPKKRFAAKREKAPVKEKKATAQKKRKAADVDEDEDKEEEQPEEQEPEEEKQDIAPAPKKRGRKAAAAAEPEEPEPAVEIVNKRSKKPASNKNASERETKESGKKKVTARKRKSSDEEEGEGGATEEAAPTAPVVQPKKGRATKKAKVSEDHQTAAEAPVSPTADDTLAEIAIGKPTGRGSRRSKKSDQPSEETAITEALAEEPATETAPKKRGGRVPKAKEAKAEESPTKRGRSASKQNEPEEAPEEAPEESPKKRGRITKATISGKDSAGEKETPALKTRAGRGRPKRN